MKLRRNEEVVWHWINNLPAKSKCLWTDGEVLISFGITIGYTRDRRKVVFNFTPDTVEGVKGLVISREISRHSRLAMKFASDIEYPEQILAPDLDFCERELEKYERGSRQEGD